MKHLLILLMLLPSLAPRLLNAQPPQRGERIEALRISFYTHELQLTPAEAQAFWPVFNEYQAKLDDIQLKRSELFREGRMGTGAPAEKDIEAMIVTSFNLEQEELDLKQQYFKEFQKVLPMQKIGKLYQAERKFRLMLLKEFRDRQQGGDAPRQGGPGRRF
jgi:hypothetical protein